MIGGGMTGRKLEDWKLGMDEGYEYRREFELG